MPARSGGVCGADAHTPDGGSARGGDGARFAAAQHAYAQRDLRRPYVRYHPIHFQPHHPPYHLHRTPFTPSVLEHLRALPSVPGPALSSSSAQSSPQGASAADPLFLSHPDTSALLLSVASAPSAAVRMSSLSIFSIIRRLQAIRIINPEARNQKKASAAPAADASLKERGHAILIEGIAASATCSSYRNVLRNGS